MIGGDWNVHSSPKLFLRGNFKLTTLEPAEERKREEKGKRRGGGRGKSGRWGNRGGVCVREVEDR